MIHVPFVDLSCQHTPLQAEITEALTSVITRGQFILGDEVDSFEAEFARYVGTRHAIGVSSGLDALRLSLAALEIGPDDEVILPANTFIATALAVSSLGATPILVDVEKDTRTIDVGLMERAFGPRTRAVIPVHLYAQPCDMDDLLGIARHRGVQVVEDSCQAHGTSYKGKRCGSLGDLGCFSFYPAKNLGALGDGGMVVTDNPALAEKARILRNYGQRRKYEHTVRGFNCRLDALQAAVLSVKLRYLDTWNAHRAQIADLYTRSLSGIPGLTVPVIRPECTHVFHLYVIQTSRRDHLRDYLATRGVQTGIHYPIPIHLQQAYAGLGYTRGDFPVTELLADTVLSLPIYPGLTMEQASYVIEAIQEVFRE